MFNRFKSIDGREILINLLQVLCVWENKPGEIVIKMSNTRDYCVIGTLDDFPSQLGINGTIKTIGVLDV